MFFTQMVPWSEMLLHTLLDCLRLEAEDGGGRLVNHHGRARTVGEKQETDITVLKLVRTFLAIFPQVENIETRPSKGHSTREAFRDLTQVQQFLSTLLSMYLLASQFISIDLRRIVPNALRSGNVFLGLLSIKTVVASIIF